MLPRQIWVGKLTLSALNSFLFHEQTNNYYAINIVMQTQAKFVLTSLKLILNFFFGPPKLALIPKVLVWVLVLVLFLRLPVWDDELLSLQKWQHL